MIKRLAKISLWLLFTITFLSEFMIIVVELHPTEKFAKSGTLNAFFWSSLLMIEIIMAGLVVYYFIKHPPRRFRLATLSICHFSAILALPLIFHDWSWVGILYPWPHTLQAFDPSTPKIVFWLSLSIGFIVIPMLTIKWGVNGFCGHVCPHGAFFSETYGRLFRPHPKRLRNIGRYFPAVYFALMAIGLIGIFVIPSSVEQIRNIQKMTFFSTAELFYFVIGIPLIGGRSYCTLMCPLGFMIRQIVKIRNKILRNRRDVG